MNPQRIVGIVLLIVGAIVMVVGMNASHSAADQVSSTITGHFTNATAWYMIGGGAASLIGLLMVVFGVNTHKA